MATRLIKNTLIVIGFIIINIANIYAYNLCGEDVWMGGINKQYNMASYGAVADNSSDDKLKISGYGRYQFNYKTNLIDFLMFLDEQYFERFINYGRGSDKLNDFSYGLQIAFTDYYNDNKDKMINKQDEFFYTTYYLVLKDKLSDKGINLTDKRLKGAVLSYAMFTLEDNEIMDSIGNEIVNKIATFQGDSVDSFISNIYDYLIELNSSNDKLKDRFESEKFECLEAFDDTLNSKIGEMLNSGGNSNSLSFIRKLNDDNPKIFKDFLVNGKFYTKQQDEWYKSVRTSANYKKEFGIDSGVLDFGISTSKGYNLDNYVDLLAEEIVLKRPNNAFPMYYIPQNCPTNIKNYSNIKFGANNIAQGGGSLACLSMCFNKLLNRNENNLILPDNIVEKIKENHDGNYNYYYNEEKKGQENEIISDVCSYYGLNASVIAGSSLGNAFLENSLVIARVQESEFTRFGQFIVIAGYQVIDGITMYCVYDPNLFHANYLYKLYDLNYLVNDCKGIFFKIKI